MTCSDSGLDIKSFRYQQNEVIIPDDILVREGFACGDRLIVMASVDDDILSLRFFCEACSQCRFTVSYLFNKLNGKILTDAILISNDILNDVKKNKEIPPRFLYNYKKNIVYRFECVYEPIKIVRDFISSLRQYEVCAYRKIDSKYNLDCDACVSTGRIDWRHDASTYADKNVNKEEQIDYKYRKRWMALGKIVLSFEEIKFIQNNYNNLTEDDIKRFSSLKIEQMIYYHIVKHCGKIKNYTLWKHIDYRKYRQNVVKMEVDCLKKFISDNNINACFIKGANMARFYNDNIGLRLFMDYDIIAGSIDEAFEISTYLFRNGFKIFYSEFSLKKIVSYNQNDRYTGHFHMQKWIKGLYKIIVDVNFPAFPMGRVSLYSPHSMSNNMVSDDDQFVITLCHLFKHKDVFMKDLNDLYLLIKYGKLTPHNISGIIKENELELFAKTALNFIEKNYNVDNEIRMRMSKIIDYDNVSIGQWPYLYDDVYNVKLADYKLRINKWKDNDRIYLFPLACF